MSRSAPPFEARGARRRGEAPSKQVARIAWILVTLLYDGVLDYAACIDRFGISRREFQRDLRNLREIGRSLGFTLSHITSGRVFLYESGRRVRHVGTKHRDAAATLTRIAAALGGPIEREVREAIGVHEPELSGGFLHVREASPSDGERVTHVFESLKAAAAGPARVEFLYTAARGAHTTRRVEPYHIVSRSGRYYLVAYDLVRRDWRHFALDAISGPMRKAGTFAPRPVPQRFLAERAVGWITGLRSTLVTFRLSSLVAAAVGARRWQEGQRFAHVADGGAEITLAFDDLGEAVRWALGFGPEAVVVAPPQAVALACEMVDGIARAYDRDARVARRDGTVA